MAVTLTNIISELEKLNRQAAKKYAEYVAAGTMTPFTRDSKLAVLQALLDSARQAAANKTTLTTELQKFTLYEKAS